MTHRVYHSALVILFFSFWIEPSISANDLDLTGIVSSSASEEWPPGRQPVGTGVVISSAGHIFTSAHVVAGCRRVSIVGDQGEFNATLIAVDARIDAAVLRAPLLAPRSFLRFSDQTIDRGEQLIVPVRPMSGNTLKLIQARSEGLGYVQGEGTLLFLDSVLLPGFSGAAVVDGNGNIAAYVVGRLRDRPNTGLGVPASQVKRFLDYLGMPHELLPKGNGALDRIAGMLDRAPGTSVSLAALSGATVSVRCNS